MPSMTVTINVDLEVDVEYRWESGEADVGIGDGPEEIEVLSIAGLVPVIQVNKPGKLDQFQTAPKMELSAWLQVSGDLQALIEEAVAERAEPPEPEERSYYDD